MDKMKTFDSLNSDAAQIYSGHELADENGESVGTIGVLWFDPSTQRVAFVGVKSAWLSGKVNALPARDVGIDQRGNLVGLRYPAAIIKKSPNFVPGVELSEVAKEEINAYYGRSMPNKRVTSIEEVRPEEALEPGHSLKGSTSSEADTERRVTNRSKLQEEEQAFFNQKGFVTDSFPEVDASDELKRTQTEAKIRNSADRKKRGDLD